MNKQRRADLEKAKAHLQNARDVIDSTREDESDAFGNMPEGLQQGERGQAMEEAISKLEEIVEACDSAIESIDEVTAS